MRERQNNAAAKCADKGAVLGEAKKDNSLPIRITLKDKLIVGENTRDVILALK